VQVIQPDWPAPPRVRAFSTTRDGGVSSGVFSSLNLGDHVGDEPVRVARNRALLRERLSLPGEPLWLRQVHGCNLVPSQAGASPASSSGPYEADGAVTSDPESVCAVMTADCLPVLMCDRQGTRVAAVHAGWRGLAAGILEEAFQALGICAKRVLVWLGPAIGPQAFEVGPEVRARFVEFDPRAAEAFRLRPDGRWLADLAELARQRFARLGVTDVYGGVYCTFSDPRRFFSYRRDGVTGRMASLIWLSRDDDAAWGDASHG